MIILHLYTLDQHVLMELNSDTNISNNEYRLSTYPIYESLIMADVKTIAAFVLHNGTSINQFAIIGHLLFIKDTNTFEKNYYFYQRILIKIIP